MKYMKIKYGLLVLLILLVMCSICMSIYFRISSMSVISHDYFGEDTTMLIHAMDVIEYPYNSFFIVIFLRSVIVISLPILSGVLIYKQRTLRNGTYLLISCYLFFIETLRLDYISTGFYNVLRKIHASYYLGITDMPWLLYYLSVLVIIILMIWLVSSEIYVYKKLRKE